MLKRGGRRGGKITGRRVRGGRAGPSLPRRHIRARGGVLVLAVWLLPAALSPALAAQPFEEHVSFGALGGVGLVHMGNARFMGDGEVAVGAHFADPLGSAFLTFQATPWLELNVRYSQSFDLADDLDRALDLKIRLLRESDWFPAVAVGLRDALGKGPWSGEYLALSKRIGPLDTTLGAGWGGYAARNAVGNPLAEISGRFDERRAGRSGVPAFRNFFRGEDIGFFAGIEYMTPIRGLSLKAEYDSSDMRGVTLDPAADKHRPYNLGLDYRPLPWLHLSLGYARGDTLQAGLAFRLNPGIFTGPDKSRDPAPLAVAEPQPRRMEPKTPRFEVPPQVPPPAPSALRPMEDVLTRVSRALVMAGIERPLFEITGEREAELTADFAPASAPRESLRAAYIVFANLPARFDRLVLRNRVGEAVGEEGQVFTRKRVADFARADAAFDALIAAGGVGAVTLEGPSLKVALNSRAGEETQLAAAVAQLAPTEPEDVEPVADAPVEEDAPPPHERPFETGRRYMPLFGYVEWSGAAEPGAAASAGDIEPLAQALEDAVFARARAEGITPLRAGRRGNVAFLAIQNDRFRHPATAIGRAARALDPVDAAWVEIATLADGAEISRVRFLKDEFARAAHAAGSPEEVWIHAAVERSPSDWSAESLNAQTFTWAVYPELMQHFGNGREDGYRAGLYATASAKARVLDGLTFEIAGSREILGNLDRIAAPAGPAPHVRSDIARYADEGKWAITTARADYTLRPFANLYLRASAGIFERMYGGAGIEALVAPQDSRLAFGIDVNWVKQRDFDQLLDFRDHSTWTGHLRLHHLSRRHGIHTVIHAGRYLAGDWGATIDVSREFENGVRIGGWFTVTDYGRSAFGADSYAKGLYLAIPFDLGLPWSSRRDLPVELRVLNRDGGQMLHKGAGLYDAVSPGSLRAVERSWRHLLK